MAIKYKAPKKRGDENELKEAIRQPEERPRGSTSDDQETDIYGMAADDSVFGEAAKDLTLKNVDPGLRAAVRTAAAETRTAADAAERESDEYVPAPPPSEPSGGAPPPAEEEPQGLFEDVTDIDARQERERQAFADELAARKAEQQQQAEARAGLGGMGLSGATAELVGDVGRQAERAGDIAMADLGRRQQQETFDELRRQASIWTFEEEFGVDLDGDGKFGSGEQEAGEEGDEKPRTTAGGEEIVDVGKAKEEQRQSNQEKYDAYHQQAGTDMGLMAASSVAGGMEAWAESTGAEEIARYRDENGVEWRVYRKADGTIVKGTATSGGGLLSSLVDIFTQENRAKA